MTTIASVFPELLEEVFDWALQLSNRRCILSSAVLPVDVAPINVSQVCRKWRQISLSQPSLWSSIFIHAESNVEVRRAVSRSTVWLDRSYLSRAPLALSVIAFMGSDSRLSDEDAEERSMLVGVLFHLLLKHQQQWKSVKFSLGPSARSFGPLNLTSVPLLKSLRWEESHLQLDHQPETEHGIIDLSSLPPSISEITLGISRYTRFRTNPSVFSLMNLTNVELKHGLSTFYDASPSRFPHINDCLVIFQCAPMLNRFAIAVESEDFGFVDETKNYVSLAALQTFEFEWSDIESGPRPLSLLDYISAPSLKTIIIQGLYGQDVTKALDTILRFIFRCSISLDHLGISSEVDDFSIFDILKASPKLRKLELGSWEFSRKDLNGLSRRSVVGICSSELILCPFLESIKLNYHRSENNLTTKEDLEEILQSIANMVMRRRDDPNPSLREVQLNVVWDPDEFEDSLVPDDSVALEDFRRMVSNGLQFRLC